jgi:hypothetical protein
MRREMRPKRQSVAMRACGEEEQPRERGPEVEPDQEEVDNL